MSKECCSYVFVLDDVSQLHGHLRGFLLRCIYKFRLRSDLLLSG